MRRGEASIRASGVATTASELAAKLSRFNLQQKEDRAARVQVLAGAMKDNPELARDTKKLMELADGDLDLVVKARSRPHTGARTLPDATGLTPGQRVPLLAGQAAGTADQAAADAKAEQDRAIAAANLEAANARADAAAKQKRAEVLADELTKTQGDLGKEARDRVAGFYTARRRRFQPSGFYFTSKGRRRGCAEATPVICSRSKVACRDSSRGGELPRNDAYAIASGDYSALATPLDQPNACSDRRSAHTEPGSHAGSRVSCCGSRPVLKEKMAEILGGGVRLTPMATPTPSPSKFVDLNTAPPEATRRGGED
mgnify:CR=1 FL=1